MKINKKWLSSLLAGALFLSSLSGITTNVYAADELGVVDVETTETSQDEAPNYNYDKAKYQLKTLIISDGDGMNIKGIEDHYKQSMVADSETKVVSIADFITGKYTGYDLIYLDSQLSHLAGFDEAVSLITEYVNGGDTVYLSNEYAETFPTDFTGISSVHKLTTTKMNFVYAQVDKDEKGMQDIWKMFADTYKQYSGLNPEHHIKFGSGVTPSTAKTIVAQDGIAYMTMNEVGHGTVIWSNNFMPSENFITNFSLVPEGDQKYFHFGYATANYMFRNEILKYVSKDKYGFALTKTYGPYGRPGLAWQNHYEELQSIDHREMIKWIDVLEDYNQIPTYSLIRSSYNWGMWKASVSYHQNIGTDATPSFRGESENSFYSSGERIHTTSGYLDRGRYPGYNTLLSKLDLPDRAVPQVGDIDRDGIKDLVAGGADGQIMFYRNVGSNSLPKLQDGVALKDASGKVINVGKHSTPYIVDFNQDGIKDLVIGNEAGKLNLYLADSEGKLTNKGILYEVGGAPVQVSENAAPAVADWDGDGVLDLIIGDTTGKVKLFLGVKGSTPKFQSATALMANGTPITQKMYSAPAVVDWNNDGALDLIVGDNSGEISLYIRENGELVSKGKVEGQNKNFFGTKAINVGHNVYPCVVDWNNDGKKDILTGQVEYGIPYNIDSSLFPHQQDLKDNIAYAQSKYVPVIPHMYFHQYRSEELEKKEIELHKQAFHKLGLRWDNDMGVNQHTWRVSELTTRTFWNQYANGIWWNFGFQPPGVGSAPRDGLEFLWTMPFTLTDGGGSGPFLVFAPAPNILNLRDAWDDLAALDMPLTYFEHIENSLTPGTAVNDRLMSKTRALEEFRKTNNYTFMTEEQMARSIINAMYTEVNVTLEGNQIKITQDISKVPANAKEYKGTLGIKVEGGEKYKGLIPNTTSLLSYHKKDILYTGIKQGETITFDLANADPGRLYIEATNAPLNYAETATGLTITANTKGMQEVKIYSPTPIKITGNGLKVTRQGNVYQVIHYGDAATIHVTK